jgi:hypothetical protein
MSTTHSRSNAVKHGFYATDELFLARLQPAERDVFERMRDALHQEYNPQREQELALVDRLAILYFRQLRLYGLEAAATDQCAEKLLAPLSVLHHLDRFSRYDWRIERQIRALHNRLYAFYSGRKDYSLRFLSGRE